MELCKPARSLYIRKIHLECTLGENRSHSLTIAPETTIDQTLHDLIVDQVAQARFGIDDWDVATNTSPDNRELPNKILPDITARSHNKVVAVGEVETHDTITEERAKQWKSFGSSCVRFYLYVPQGAEEETMRLISKHQVECAGLRSYSMNGRLSLNPVYLDNSLCRDDDHPWWNTLGSCDND